MDGTIRQWNIKEGKCLQIFEINSPIHTICSDYSNTDYLFILIENNTSSKSPRKWSIIHYNLKTKNGDEVILSVEGPRPIISTKQYTENFSDSYSKSFNKRLHEDIVTILVISHENIMSIYNSNTKKLITHTHVYYIIYFFKFFSFSFSLFIFKIEFRNNKSMFSSNRRLYSNWR